MDLENINYKDNIVEEMLIKEANNRNIVINQNVDTETMYKAMYWIKKGTIESACGTTRVVPYIISH